MTHDANYIEERILQPLQRAVSLLRDADQLTITITQRQAKIDDLGKELAMLTRKKAEAEAGIVAMRANLTEQRNELQALVQSDRLARQHGVQAHEQEKRAWAEEKSSSLAELKSIRAEVASAEKQLAGLKTDLASRLMTLKSLAS